MKKHSVVIVDDHLLFAQSLQGLVNAFDEFEVLYGLSCSFCPSLEPWDNSPNTQTTTYAIIIMITELMQNSTLLI